MAHQASARLRRQTYAFVSDQVDLAKQYDTEVDGSAKTGKWALFVLPFITVLREGLEAVVFVGGVSLGQSATAIPIAAIVGIICGLVCGFLIYSFASRASRCFCDRPFFRELNI